MMLWIFFVHFFCLLFSQRSVRPEFKIAYAQKWPPASLQPSFNISWGTSDSGGRGERGVQFFVCEKPNQITVR